MKRFGFAVFFTALSIVGCNPGAPMDTRAADERAIRAEDAAGLKAAQARDVNGAVANYADDASWFPPNAPIAKGKDAIRAGWGALLASPGLTIDWQITKLEVARSGDLAYILYVYQMSMQGPNGKPIEDHGKDMAVWKKQQDGTWKMVADTFNSDVAIAPSSNKSDRTAPKPK
jgi:uncharacterized protein (TIGR02246 family)